MNELNKNIELAVQEIEKKYGLGAIMRMDAKPRNVEFIPTHSLNINQALGVGGFPIGRIIEISGRESSGKTTLATSVMINAQKKFPEKEVAIIDAEHSYDIQYAENMGLDLARVRISQPVIGNEALEIVRRLIESQGFSCIVIDSTAALSPKEEFEDLEFDTNRPGLQGKLISQMLRNCAGRASETGTTIIFISQERANISQMSRKKYITTGGNGIKFYATIRISLQPIERIEPTSNSKFHGIRVKVSIDKNKLAPPHKVCEMIIYYGMGICQEVEILEKGIEAGIIDKNHASYTFGESKFRGQDALLRHMIENPQDTNNIRKKLEEALVAKAK